MESTPKRGRPPGSRNKIRGVAKADYRHIDPDTIIGRQIAMLEMAQRALRNELAAAEEVDALLVQKLERMSNAIVRAVDAMRKSSDLADELAARLTPEQLLEAAIKKLEGQDVATITYAIKRLRAHRELLQPSGAPATDSAAASLAELA